MPDVLGTLRFPPFAILIQTSQFFEKDVLKRSLNEVCQFRPLETWCQRKKSKQLNVRILSTEILNLRKIENRFEPESPPNSPPQPVKDFRNKIIYENISSNFYDDFDVNLDALRKAIKTLLPIFGHFEIWANFGLTYQPRKIKFFQSNRKH